MSESSATAEVPFPRFSNAEDEARLLLERFFNARSSDSLIELITLLTAMHRDPEASQVAIDYPGLITLLAPGEENHARQ